MKVRIDRVKGKHKCGTFQTFRASIVEKWNKMQHSGGGSGAKEQQRRRNAPQKSDGAFAVVAPCSGDRDFAVSLRQGATTNSVLLKLS
jgi:hypothetical protein